MAQAAESGVIFVSKKDGFHNLLSDSYKQRMAIRDICREFEKDHSPYILITVDPGATRYKWIINMLSCGFNNNGEFSKEAQRTIFYKAKDLDKYVEGILNEMFYELYESR